LVLEVSDLSVEFRTGKADRVLAADRVSFSLEDGRTLAILGESGSGKSQLLRALLGIQPATARVTGRVLLAGRDLLAMPARERAQIRGARIAMVFQNPTTSLDPVYTVGQQLVETIRRHSRLTTAESRRRALELLELVQIPSAEQRLRAYPFELSGGTCQRVGIALALASTPEVILADEPTTALDVTVQARILELLQDIQKELRTSIVLVTHDVAVAADVAHDVAVMYAGRFVESGPADEVLQQPRHPYTRGLLAANLQPGQREAPVAIAGSPPDLKNLPVGCAFAPRCPDVIDACRVTNPELIRLSPIRHVRCILAADSSESAVAR
jgi:oligopeptide/dipeptide ABC transporter ATP-binding protein